MKVVIYETNAITRAIQLLESVTATGTSSFHALSELDSILKNGTNGDYKEEKDGDANAVEHKEIQPDKLAK